MPYLDSSASVFCPHCTKEMTWPLPDLPLYTLKEALTVIPISGVNHLYQILHRLRAELDPPRYAHGEYGRRYRLLSARDIQHINRRIRLTLKGVCGWLRRE